MSEDPFADPVGYEGDDVNETTFAQGRLAGHVYHSNPFPYARPGSSDNGNPARFVYQVFDNPAESGLVLDGEEYLVSQTPAGRFQFKLVVVRDVGRVKELWVHRVPTKESAASAKILLNLKGDDAQRLVDMLKTLDHMPLNGTAARIPESVIQDILNDPTALERAYKQQGDRFRNLIEDDPRAADVMALARRRKQVEIFHRLLEDDGFFDSVADAAKDKKPEGVWQRFFESNPWILGMALGTQLLTSWDAGKLEQVTAGRSVFGVGKRTDALMTTSGRIKSMVFAEIKTHRTPLLERDFYRAGCWAPAKHLSGGVAQVQGTVHRASLGFIDRLQKQDADGTDSLNDFAYLLRPKSYLIVGQLSEFESDAGGHHQDKVRSFELYRRHLDEPEVITFDELLARADWLVSTVEADLIEPPAVWQD